MIGRIRRRLMNGSGIAAAAAMPIAAWVSLAPAAQPVSAAPPATRTLSDAMLAQMCTAESMQAVAAGLSTARVTVQKIVDGPFAAATQLIPAKGHVPAFCQVTGSFVTNPATGKTANFLGNFPIAWNGKYLQIGCSSHCGQFYVSNPAMPSVIVTTQGNPGDIIAKGYAAFATDEGHAGMAAADWAVRKDGSVDQDALDDFYYRADKILADLGKEFTAAFYARAEGGSASRVARSYFVGCSGGGRDAMVATSYFPDKFDGIIAGSPYDPTGMGLHSIGLDIARARPGAAISPAQFELVDQVVKKQCDAADGVEDGVIQNPLACNFRPERDLPRCTGDQPGGQCFTKPQVEYVSAIVSAMTDEQGRIVQPGHSVSEIRGTGLTTLGPGLQKVFVHRNDPAFEPGSVFTLKSGGPQVDSFHVVIPSAEAALVRKELRLGAGHLPENMGRLAASRTKLLMWHNWSDEALTPLSSVNWYNALAKRYGGLAKVQRQARLFLLPGTHHCSIEGIAPNQFDALSAMENWVERGRAPDELLLTVANHQFSPGAKPAAAMQSPNWTAKVCKYPTLASYRGQGDVKDAANWTCRPDDRRGLEVGESGRLGGVVP